MAKYINELKYTDPATQETYYVDTRAIKDPTNDEKDLNDLLADKQALLPGCSIAGKALTSTNSEGVYTWEESGKIATIISGGKNLSIEDKKVVIDSILTKSEYDALSEEVKKMVQHIMYKI